MTPTIRRIRAEEAERFVDDLWLPFAREMEEIDDYDALADQGVRENAVEYRRREFENEDKRSFVAEDGEAQDGDLVGHVNVELKESPPVFARGTRGYVHGLYVRPDYRGEGLATELMARAREWAERRGCESFSLDVHAENEAAASFYRKLGFAEKRRRLVKPLDR